MQIPKNWRPVVGFHAIREAMNVHGKYIEEAWFKQGYEGTQELKELAKDLKSMGLQVQEKPAALLDRLYPSHQGAALFMGITPSINWPELEQSTHSTVLVLDGLEDPHNLGAILRTSWLMDVDGVLVPEDRAAGLTATVHKVACGGVEHVPVEKVTNFSNPIEKLKKMATGSSDFPTSGRRLCSIFGSLKKWFGVLVLKTKVFVLQRSVCVMN